MGTKFICTWKNSDNSSNDRTYDPTILLLDIYIQEMKYMCSCTQKACM